VAKRAAPNNGANAAPAGIPDPEFAMIDAHKVWTKEWCRFYNKLDEAEFEAGKTQGKRPMPMIAWRNYPMIAEYGIDKCREELLSQPGADKKQVEKDYRDAKARLAAAERAGVEWDHRAGIAPLREQYERANAAGAPCGYANGPDETDDAGRRGCPDCLHAARYHGRRSRLTNGRAQGVRRRACPNDPAKNNSASLVTRLIASVSATASSSSARFASSCGACPRGAFLGPRGGEFTAKNKQCRYCEDDY
jgi:hypothetical protein